VPGIDWLCPAAFGSLPHLAKECMKIVVLDTYYAAFLAAHYAAAPDLKWRPYDEQRQSLLRACFGTSDFYSRHLNALGCDAQDLIVNCRPLQAEWAREHRASQNTLALQLPHRLFRLPLVGPLLAKIPGLADVAVAQIKAIKPDVLYCQDLSFFTPERLSGLKNHVRLIVGQIASPLPPDSFVKGYDLILTSFPHFVPRLRGMGVASDYFRIGFDPRVLEMLGHVEKDIPVSFVGGISRHHNKAVSLLEHIAETTPIQFFGYGAQSLPPGSPIRQKHQGEIWGLDMYRALARSHMTLNRHINVSENYANNMRLYEATGTGTMLLTDRKDNLGELFEIGKEVVVYTTQEEAVELIRYYTAHPDEAAAIAGAGQRRTLCDHTYATRMQELVPILRRHLGDNR
jgi:spore maturation protein CgeB